MNEIKSGINKMKLDVNKQKLKNVVLVLVCILLFRSWYVSEGTITRSVRWHEKTYENLVGEMERYMEVNNFSQMSICKNHLFSGDAPLDVYGWGPYYVRAFKEGERYLEIIDDAQLVKALKKVRRLTRFESILFFEDRVIVRLKTFQRLVYMLEDDKRAYSDDMEYSTHIKGNWYYMKIARRGGVGIDGPG